jgi:UPF0755 protein
MGRRFFTFGTAAVLFFIALYGVQRVYKHFHPAQLPPPPAREEVSITIIPGWNLRQVADYLVIKGLASSTDAVYALTGKPALDYRWLNTGRPYGAITSSLAMLKNKPEYVSYEGYLAPETFRVFKDAPLEDILKKFLGQRDDEVGGIDLDQELYDLNAYIGPKADKFGSYQTDQPASSYIYFHQALTMASIIEKETRHAEDRAIVSDILWRRWAAQMALQVDSSVHYAVDKTGDVFTTDKERSIDSFWNTYKYPGLPPGPICNPSVESIKAALNPEKNSYWYFLTGKDGVMHYAKTLDEHNRNKKYL